MPITELTEFDDDAGKVNLRRMWGNRQRYQVMLYEHEELEEDRDLPAKCAVL